MNYPKQLIKPKFIDVYDVETNGLHWLDDLITLSCFRLDYDSLTVVDELNLTHKPSGQWNYDSQRVHGITEQKAKTFLSTNEFISILKSWLPKTKSVFGCHALNMAGYFDWGCVMGMFFKYDCHFNFYNAYNNTESTVDFLRLAVNEGRLNSIIAKDRGGRLKPTYKLKPWCKRFNIELKHHDARSDANATVQIYKILRGL